MLVRAHINMNINYNAPFDAGLRLRFSLRIVLKFRRLLSIVDNDIAELTQLSRIILFLFLDILIKLKFLALNI